jgi:Ca2+-binding EF-hand superfamily protein
MCPTLSVHELAACAVVQGALALLSACGAASTTRSASTPATDPSPSAWDTDGDGTVDWTETKAAALRKFATIDTDHDATVDSKEIAAANVGASAFEKADTDHDGTLTTDEYLELVHGAFTAADRDRDGTVSAGELRTSEGQLLEALAQ